MKIGFVVQKDWKTKHFGVRNYFTTIMSILKERHQVDCLVYEQDKNKDGMWFLYNDREINANKKQTKIIEIGQSFSYSTYATLRGDQLFNEDSLKYKRCIGNDLSIENYDVIVITNPWSVNFQEKLPAKKVIGIVYDLVANEYALRGVMQDYQWGYLHNRGYQYYLKNCSDIYAISEKITNEFNRFYQTTKCNTINPFPPYAYRNLSESDNNRENAICLAAPFDLRKGITIMPDIINQVYDELDTLYIYGKPRCELMVFDEFFKKMNVKKIIYYPYISPEDLQLLYKKCKILLFPSREEGLGIPIIEAQICGCRVVTTNIPPMNQLILGGSYLLGTDDDIDKIKMMMKEDFDYKHLSEKAREVFSFSGVEEMFVG